MTMNPANGDDPTPPAALSVRSRRPALAALLTALIAVPMALYSILSAVTDAMTCIDSCDAQSNLI